MAQPPAEREPPDPRFLLANERTMLAWLRTALAFVATGLGLVALGHVGLNSDWLLLAAAASCLVGIVTAGWAHRHWRQVDAAIRDETALPVASIGPVLVVGVVLLALTGIIVVASRL